MEGMHRDSRSIAEGLPAKGQRLVFTFDMFKYPTRVKPLRLEFVRMLNSMRFGRIETDDAKRFAALSRPLVYDDGIEPTELCVLPYIILDCKTVKSAPHVGFRFVKK